MSYPNDKETFAVWTDRSLIIFELGTRIVKTRMEPVRDCVERIQDAIGYTTGTETVREWAALWAMMN